MSADLPPLSAAGRVARFREALTVHGIEHGIVSGASTRRWLSGFTGSNGDVVVTPDRVVLVTDGRYGSQAERQISASGAGVDEVMVTTTVVEQRRRVDELCAGAGRVGFESMVWSHAEWSAHGALDDLVPIDSVVSQLRRRKDAAEIARMTEAARIASVALAAVEIAPGVSERDIRDSLESTMRAHGADGPSYETIVASGPDNAAMAHHRPSRRVLEVGDTVVIDVGALLDGYHSDMTRSFVVGDPSDEQQRWYAALSRAQRAGLDAVSDGVATREVDAACRESLAEEGLADLFTHGTGHGVGLDIHEEPFLGRSTESVLAAGDVVTVEPGLYRVGAGGMRIEDLVLVTESGHRSLTDFPKDDPCPPSPPTT